jgi:hypothetical protein
VDAEADNAAQDVTLDIVVPVDPCDAPRSAVVGDQLYAGGPTPTDFATAFNAEMNALTVPGPFMVVFDGLDSTQEADWVLKIGTPQGDPPSFDGTPASAPFRLGEKHSIYAQADASFAMRFGTVDIPVVQFSFGGQFDDKCAVFSAEEFSFLIPSSAANIVFHGSTLDDLLGPPTASFDGGKYNAWFVSLSGQMKAVQVP